MSEPRRSTRARAREDAAPAPPPEPAETPSKTPAKSLKRKRAAPTPKDATPARSVAETPQSKPEYTLPVRLVEGQPLPTLPEPQHLDSAAGDYQDVRQSGVLSASLQRSRAVWISGSNFRLFHAFFTPPKKVADRTDEDKQAMQRQKDIIRNFPQLGGQVEAQLVIEPHTFPIRLYGPREYVRHTQKKAPPPQYGQWPNHNQYPPYHQQPQPYGNPPVPYTKPAPPMPRPSQPKPQQRPPPPANTTPAPDPVIQALAQRAGTDPELKAVMKIVASGGANPEQLSFFQRHIAELTAKLEKQKAEAARAPPPPPPPPVQQPPPPMHPPQVTYPAPQTPQTPHVPVHGPPPQLHQQQQHHHHHRPPSGTYQPPMIPNQHAPPQTAPPMRPPHPNQYTYNQPHQQAYNQTPQPPRTTYRPLVFDFVEGNGDKFYLPSYSFMEWIGSNGNYQGIKFSFLITKMKPKLKEEVKEKEKEKEPPATPAPKALQPPNAVITPAVAQGSDVTPQPAGTPNVGGTTNASVSGTPSMSGAPNPNPNPNPNTPMPNTPHPSQSAAQTPAATPSTPQYVPPPRIEDFDEKKDIPDIELYRPITVVIYTQNLEILQSLPRAFRPADVVHQYMEEIFDKCTRDEETHLAFRLPKENVEVAGGASGAGEGVSGSGKDSDTIMEDVGAVRDGKRSKKPRPSVLA